MVKGFQYIYLCLNINYVNGILLSVQLQTFIYYLNTKK